MPSLGIHVGGLMIESIEFHNFKVLREATLQLGRFNLLVGPNGSGKSTVLTALTMAMRAAAGASTTSFDHVISTGSISKPTVVTIRYSSGGFDGLRVDLNWRPCSSEVSVGFGAPRTGAPPDTNVQVLSNQ